MSRFWLSNCISILVQWGLLQSRGNLATCLENVFYRNKTTHSIYIRGSWRMEVNHTQVIKKSNYYTLFFLSLALQTLCYLALLLTRFFSILDGLDYPKAFLLSGESFWRCSWAFRMKNEHQIYIADLLVGLIVCIGHVRPRAI
jgi:hypothetical protein